MKLYLSLLFTLLASVSSLFAEQNVNLNGSSWMSKVTPLPSAPFPTSRGIVASYDLTWKGKIKAGNATVVLGSTKNSVIEGKVSGQSTGLASKLFPYTFTYQSKFSKGEKITPIYSTVKENTRKSVTNSKASFSNSGTVSNRVETEKKTSTKKNVDRNFLLSGNLAQCVFSALINSRSQALTKGQEITTLVIPVDRPYLLKFTVLGREKRRVKGKSYNTIKLDLKILGKVNNDKSLKTYDKIKTCSIWLNDDADRLPLELRAELFVGHMTVYQTSLKYTN